MGGGGGGESIDNTRNPTMTKEAMMEDLFKRSADSSTATKAAVENSGASAAAAEPVWQEAGGFNLELGKIISLFHS